MKLEKVYLSLGTNEGDRQANIQRALSSLDSSFGKPFKKVSSVIETPSWGFDGADFLNCVVLYELSEEPLEILKKCKQIEREMGREQYPLYDESGNRVYNSRIIDIDILLIGDRRVESSELTVPHPLMQKRAFVMEPLMEIIESK